MNEFGKYLPSSDAELYEESERIHAKNDKKAEQLCADVAEQYLGINPKINPTGNDNEYDCSFDVWREQ